LIHARGVRYGSAPRFAQPEPAAPWRGVVDAIERGPACPQAPYRLGWVTGPILAPMRFDEDCLRVTVTAPVPDGERRPVMVWLHGGAYISGSGEAPSYDASALALEQGVIVVNVSYRLGLLGFLGIEGVAPANLGLLDMLLALRWVQENISAFGGDPTNVTLFGHSAGAHAAYHLLQVSEARSLFQRVILQSAPLGLPPRSDAIDRVLGEVARNALGADFARIPVERVLHAQRAVSERALSLGLPSALIFGPQVGQPPLPSAQPREACVRAIAERADVMIGATKHDAGPFVAVEPRLARVRELGVLGRAITAMATSAATHRVFMRPARQLVRELRAAGGKASAYRFDGHAEDSALGSCHCVELPFLLGSAQAWSGAPMLGTSEPESRAALGRAMRARWARFARSGVDEGGAALELLG
jgi:para-nitrobenzyl esterase